MEPPPLSAPFPLNSEASIVVLAVLIKIAPPCEFDKFSLNTHLLRLAFPLFKYSAPPWLATLFLMNFTLDKSISFPAKTAPAQFAWLFSKLLSEIVILFPEYIAPPVLAWLFLKVAFFIVASALEPAIIAPPVFFAALFSKRPPVIFSFPYVAIAPPSLLFDLLLIKLPPLILRLVPW